MQWTWHDGERPDFDIPTHWHQDEAWDSILIEAIEKWLEKENNG